MSQRFARKEWVRRGGIGFVLLVLISVLLPASWEAELTTLSYMLTGIYARYYPPVSVLAPIALTASSTTLHASVLQIYPDDSTYLINAHDGSLQTVLSNHQNLSNVDQSVYFTYHQDTLQSGTLTAIHLSDNTSLWHYTFQPSPLSYTTQLQNGILFFASSEEGGNGPSILYAFSEQSGTMLWHHIVQHSSNFLYTIQNGSVYIIGEQGIEALSITDGKERWFHQGGTLGMYDIVADSSNVYLAGTSIQALGINDGQTRWTIKQNHNPYPYLSGYLGMQSGILYAADDQFGSNGEVKAIDVQDGKIVWDLKLREKYSSKFVQQPASNGRNILSFTNGTLYWLINNDIYAFRGSDGQQSWHFQGQTLPVSHANIQLQILADTDGVLYVQIGDELLALQSSNGQKLWSFTSPHLSQMKAVISGSTIFYGYAEHISNAPPPPHYVIDIQLAFPPYTCLNTIHLFALQARSGTVQWHKHFQVPCTR